MVTLFLLRHAKASQSSPDGDDRSRPLNERGQGAAAVMGRHMRDHGFHPDRVLCSPAARTRETLQILSAAAGWTDADPARSFHDSLYLAAPSEIVDLLQQLNKSCAAALVVGHNPGLHDLAITLAGPQGEDYQRLLEKYPTGALAVLTAPSTTWKQVGTARMALKHYAVPRDLVG